MVLVVLFIPVVLLYNYCMGQFGGFYKGEKKKNKKQFLEKKAQQFVGSGVFVLPKVEIIKKGKKDEK